MSEQKIIATNKKAMQTLDIEEKIEAGISLLGSEVKSIKEGRVSFKDSYVKFQNGEAYIVNLDVGPYPNASIRNHDRMRKRKLLLHKNQIFRLMGKVTERGYTVVPLQIYLNEKGLIKVLIGLGKGKKLYDKRREIKERELKRRIEREIKYGY
ncbi:MAG: SsrA-binding protein SmpB [Caldisericia bacterium]|jgi:SsrA-binding protein|nr:SsrA-binding protein SmpB [Caldisericia bacterium]